jgi:hypothetical protein
VETSGKPQTACLNITLLKRDVKYIWSPFEIKTIFIPDDPQTPVCGVLSTELPETIHGQE